MREDEIEALLKFDKARLVVVHRDDLVGAVEPYTAIIINAQGASFARGGATRLEAVRTAWGVYNDYKNTPVAERHTARWFYEHAMGDVEIHLKKLLEEKHNGK